MKKLTFLLSFFAFITVSSVANAACNRDECYGKGIEVVTSMMVHEGGDSE